MNVLNIKEEKKQLEKQIKSIDAELKRFPEMGFYCAKNGTSFKWYEKDGKVLKYITKENRGYAEKLANRKFLLAKRNDIIQEITAINSYLTYHNATEGEAMRLLSSPGYAALLTSYLKPVDHEFYEWMNAPYVRNEQHKEHLIYKAGENLLVRSKSEVLIALQLRMKKIPFRYECLLQVGNTEYYPDFTIIHPKTGKIFYWEHFGKMDDEKYRNKAFIKMHNYAKEGIIPGANLIMTFETKDHPLDVDMIEKMVSHYLE